MKREGLSPLGAIQKITEAPANNWINSSVDGGFYVNNPLLTLQHINTPLSWEESFSHADSDCFILPQVEIGFGWGGFVKLRGIILCQLHVFMRVFSEAKGWGCYWEEEMTCFLNWLKFLLWLLLPKYQRGLPGILFSHSVTKEMNELRGLWKDLLLFCKCVLADNLLVQGGIWVLFSIFVSPAPSRMQCI